MSKPVANAGADIILDLDGIFTLGNSQQINNIGGTPGAITDFGDGTSISSYKWYILDGPSSHGASLVSSTIQSPTLQNIDTWGNYRLLLVVTNDVGTKSEEDPNLAPDSAFMTVRLISAQTDLEKPAKGERNWHTKYHAAVGVLDQLDDDFRDVTGTHTIAFHDTTATGAELDILTGAGYATDDETATGTKLHKHAGTHVDLATTDGATQGVVKLVSSTNDPYQTDRVFASQTVHLHATATGSYVKRTDGSSISFEWTPFIITDYTDQAQNGLQVSPAHVVFWIPEQCIIRDATVSLQDSGFKASSSTTNDWLFDFRLLTASQFTANLWHQAADANYVAPNFTCNFQSLKHFPNYGTFTASDESLVCAARSYVVVSSRRDPYAMDPVNNEPGGGLHVSLLLTRGNT